jgi:hypothetical protein
MGVSQAVGGGGGSVATGSGVAGGGATATGDVTAPGNATNSNVTATAGAAAGSGGDSSQGSGAAGGAAVARSKASSSGLTSVNSSATAQDGNGGSGSGVGNAGGAGGASTASASGTSTGAGFVGVSASAGGASGSGGNGFGGASGGAGASESVMNAVSGSTAGQLVLTQSASGGLGGNTSGALSGSAGMGGNASSALDVADKDAASLTATVEAGGGSGGGTDNGKAGAGGDAVATLTATSTTASSVTGAAAAAGGDGGFNAAAGIHSGTGGNASANVSISADGGAGSATATGGASAVAAGSADAIASISNAKSGGAAASSRSNDGAGDEVLTTAGSPVGGPASAATKTAIATGEKPSVTLVAGQAQSVAALTPGGRTFGAGAMSAGYGGEGESLTYTDGADFDFTTAAAGTLYVDLVSNVSSGVGFDSLGLDIDVNGEQHTYGFTNLASAEAFFDGNALDLGSFAVGSQVVEFTYTLTASESDFAGFGFTYNAAGLPIFPAVPETKTWVMTLLGFGSLAYAAFRRQREIGDSSSVVIAWIELSHSRAACAPDDRTSTARSPRTGAPSTDRPTSLRSDSPSCRHR